MNPLRVFLAVFLVSIAVAGCGKKEAGTQAQAQGAVSIVIPPWNGVFGKKVYGNVDELELEPVTTSAKALREAVASGQSKE